MEREFSILAQQWWQSLASYDQHCRGPGLLHGQDSCMANKLHHWMKIPTNSAVVAYTVLAIWAAMRAELDLNTSAACFLLVTTALSTDNAAAAPAAGD